MNEITDCNKLHKSTQVWVNSDFCIRVICALLKSECSIGLNDGSIEYFFELISISFCTNEYSCFSLQPSIVTYFTISFVFYIS